jgi:3-hydroxybutyryl-CoA dehydrogenase
MTRLSVVGGGFMGSQIATQAALHGLEVWLQDISAEQLERSMEANRGHLQRRVDRGRLTAEEMEAALARVRTITDLAPAVREAEVVIEAIVERLEPKRELFAELDRICPQETILASNSSTMVISEIASATGRADRCVNMHFFSPVLVMELVEIVKGPETSEATVERCMDLVREIGRTPVLLRKEIDGFIVNRILHHASQEAYRLLDAGVASFRDIDTAVEKGLNWPMGPFKLGDFTGLDVTYNARRHIYEKTGDPAYRPSEQLKAKVEAGELGRKTGRGWYDWSSGKPE